MSGVEIITLLSAAAGAVGAIQQGSAQAAAARASADAARQQAKGEINVANANAAQIRRQGDVEAGQQVAAAAGSGLLLEGSLGDVIAQNRAARIQEAAGQIWQGQARATSLRNEAAIYKSQASAVKQGAMGAATLSLLSGGGKLALGGFGSGGTTPGLLVPAPPDYGIYL